MTPDVVEHAHPGFSVLANSWYQAPTMPPTPEHTAVPAVSSDVTAATNNANNSRPPMHPMTSVDGGAKCRRHTSTRHRTATTSQSPHQRPKQLQQRVIRTPPHHSKPLIQLAIGSPSLPLYNASPSVSSSSPPISLPPHVQPLSTPHREHECRQQHYQLWRALCCHPFVAHALAHAFLHATYAFFHHIGLLDQHGICGGH